MLHLFKHPSLDEVIAKELAEARHALRLPQVARPSQFGEAWWIDHDVTEWKCVLSPKDA